MKTLKTLAYPIAAGMVFTSASGCRAATFAESLNDGTVTVRVVDDTDVPLEGVQAIMYSLSDEGTSKLGLTDTNGMYSVQLRKIYAEIDGHFTKTGYYKSNGVFWKWDKWGGVPPASTNFTIVMKRIVEPVQMREIEVNVKFPRLDAPVGFDLEAGDWVSPHGKGKIADIFLTGKGYYNSPNEYAFNMFAEFPNEHDGIQSFHVPSLPDAPTQLLRSELPPPPIAPESGYEKTFERFTKRIPADRWSGTTSRDDTRRWIFRVRTKVEENGNIVSANYGWMTKDIVGASNEGKGRFALTYYYNPDPKSRSLEPKEIADRQAKDMPKEIPKEGGK